MTAADPVGVGTIAPAKCDVCSHPVANHDQVSLRFCAATSANALTRACLCRGST